MTVLPDMRKQGAELGMHSTWTLTQAKETGIAAVGS